MDLIKRAGKKVGPIEDICHKCKYSWQGVLYCFTHETSFIIEGSAIVAAIVLAIVFKLSALQWILSISSIFWIMISEYLNTGIEAAIDLVTEEFHPLAKIAKDCGSAATFTSSCLAVFVNLLIYIPIIFK